MHGRKSYLNAGYPADSIYYFHDVDRHEIDTVIVDGDTLYPVEIKKGIAVRRDRCTSFVCWRGFPARKWGAGAVICRIDHLVPLSDTVIALPVEFI